MLCFSLHWVISNSFSTRLKHLECLILHVYVSRYVAIYDGIMNVTRIFHTRESIRTTRFELVMEHVLTIRNGEDSFHFKHHLVSMGARPPPQLPSQKMQVSPWKWSPRRWQPELWFTRENSASTWIIHLSQKSLVANTSFIFASNSKKIIKYHNGWKIYNNLVVAVYVMLHCTQWPVDQLADGHLGLGLNDRRLLGAALNCRVSQLIPVTSPGCKLPTQSQMANVYLKVYVQNAKLFSHELQNISELRTSEHFQTSKNFSQRFFWHKCFSWQFFSNNFSLLCRPLHCIKGICMYLLKFHCKNPEMYHFHCFQDHYILIK